MNIVVPETNYYVHLTTLANPIKGLIETHNNLLTLDNITQQLIMEIWR
jgi:hypothetical protein